MGVYVCLSVAGLFASEKSVSLNTLDLSFRTTKPLHHLCVCLTRLWTPCSVWLWQTREQHPERCTGLMEVLKLGSKNKARPELQGARFYRWAFDLCQLLSLCCATWKLSSCERPGGGPCLSDRQAAGFPWLWRSKKAQGSAGIQPCKKNSGSNWSALTDSQQSKTKMNHVR